MGLAPPPLACTSRAAGGDAWPSVAVGGVMLATLLGACAATPPATTTTTPLRGTTWVMVPLTGPPPAADAVQALSPRAAQLRLDPQAARVSGSTGCNRLQGGFELQGERLRLPSPATTRMACLGPAGEAEPAFLQALQATRRWRVQGEVLHLLDDDSRVLMRLRAAPASAVPAPAPAPPATAPSR